MANYSYNTSLPAYHDNAINKRRQAEEILRFINKGPIIYFNYLN